MGPSGPSPDDAPAAAHLAKGGDARSCPNCGIGRQAGDPSCVLCETERPPSGWARVMQRGITPLDDAPEWAIEARLRPAGPVLRHRVRCTQPGLPLSIGILYIVNDAALFPAFEDRVRALATVQHPSVLAPLRWGHHRGQPYRVDPLVPALRLSACLATVPPPAIRGFVRHLAEGVFALHQQGLIHGNIGPRRVAMVNRPEGPTAVLVNTPAFAAGPWVPEASPEVLRGHAPDARTDVFGLGLVFWALVHGRDPRHESRTTWADDRAGPALDVDPDSGLSAADRDLLCAMLDRRAGERPADLPTLLARLRAAPAILIDPFKRAKEVPRSSPVPPPPAPSPPRAPRLAGAAVGLACAAGLAVAVWPSDPTGSPAVRSELSGLRAVPSSQDLSAGPARVAEEVVPRRPSEAIPALSPAPRRAAATVASSMDADDATPGSSAAPEAAEAPAGTAASQSGPPPDDPPASRPADLPADLPVAEPAESMPASTAPEAPPRPPAASDALAGAWTGTLNGQPARIQLYAGPVDDTGEGNLGGLASLRLGGRPSQHAMEGRYRLNADGSIRVSLLDKGTQTAWTGRVVAGRLSGQVLYDGKQRGSYTFER